MALRVKVSSEVAGLNPQWGKNAKGPIEEEMRNAIRKWVDYLANRLPTYTDTVRGTLQPAARIARSVITTRGNKAPWKKNFVYQGNSFPLGFMKGNNYAKASLQTVNTGAGIQCTFEYSNWLPYFIWNNRQAPPPWLTLPSNPPWKALEAAAQVFDSYVKTTMPGRLRATLGNLTITVKVLKAL